MVFTASTLETTFLRGSLWHNDLLTSSKLVSRAQRAVLSTHRNKQNKHKYKGKHAGKSNMKGNVMEGRFSAFQRMIEP